MYFSGDNYPISDPYEAIMRVTFLMDVAMYCTSSGVWISWRCYT